MGLLLTFQETENYTFMDRPHKYIFWKVNYFQTWVGKDLLEYILSWILQQASWGQNILVYILSNICFACAFAKNFLDVIKIRNAI